MSCQLKGLYGVPANTFIANAAVLGPHREESMMPDQPAAPNSLALAIVELCETLDLLSTVIDSVSDRMDSQTQVVAGLAKVATEAQQASSAARAQSGSVPVGEQAGSSQGQNEQTFRAQHPNTGHAAGRSPP